GVSGAGYNTHELKEALEKILGKDKIWNVVVLGVGHLGSALLSYPGFKDHGLNIVAAFDSDPRKVGKQINEIPIFPVSALKKESKTRKVSIGIISTSAKNAQEVAEILVDAGITCILNFAPVALNVPEHVKIKDVDLSRELESLSYYAAR
ncbi:MAG: redox-sensing transcriptional repressor Rex, partial [Elusimicrobia bacterium]|nr:redox-sensing transcriptional repressor Rex [Elusimicrobiota bacterium]MBD3411778.1 redox-sensing transcriptional repressor Rex [Elusimicrobiota bacterium]